MTQRILVSTSPGPSAMGQVLLELAQETRELQSKMAWFNGAVARMNNGPDNQAVANEIGVQLADVPALLSLLISVTAALNVAIITEFVEEVGQG